ncbi:MAG: hypothetical protein ACK5IJ_12110 [Mangrovibacterium sp.]
MNYFKSINQSAKLSFAILFIAFLGFVGCSEENDLGVNDDTLGTETADGMMVLGKQLENPYSVENMQKALQELQALGMASKTGIVIETTHLYVRFLPKDSTEYRILDEQLDLELFNFPLDYEILEEGGSYHDPEIPENKITWQYTTVEPTFQFPEHITYEILQECFIPEDTDYEGAEEYSEESMESKFSAVDIEKIAFQIAGVIDTVSNEMTTKKRYYPSGTIRMYDDILNTLVGVKGVKIRCHNFVKWSTSFTDANGHYSMDSKFGIGPHYAIVFDNAKGFEIYGNWGPLAKANYNMGWHDKKGHSRDLYKNSTSWDWCAVNNAAYDYYNFCNKEGISTPPSSLKIWVFRHFENASCAPMFNKLHAMYGFKTNNGVANFFNFFLNFATNSILMWFQPLMPDITIGCKGSNTKEIYNTVNHELAHASHFVKAGQQFWADYVSYIITYKNYGNTSDRNSGVCGVGEMWGYAIGSIQEKTKYGSVTTHGHTNWFKPQIISELYHEKILSIKQIHDCMTSSVRSHLDLRNKMVTNHPSLKDKINNKFEKYGFK